MSLRVTLIQGGGIGIDLVPAVKRVVLKNIPDETTRIFLAYSRAIASSRER